LRRLVEERSAGARPRARLGPAYVLVCLRCRFGERKTLAKFMLRWGIMAVAVAVAAWIVPGIHVYGPHRIWTVVVVALVLGLVNAFVRPILYALSCGLIVLTLGVFTLVINGLMLWLASWITSDGIGLEFSVDGFWNAVLGALIISVVSVVVSLTIGGKGRK
jgi:putative membrane protein